MKNNVKKNAAILVMALIVTMLFAACGQPSETNQSATTPEVSSSESIATASSTPEAVQASISGSAVAVGSSALQPLAERAAELFMGINKDAQIQVQGGGSGTGLKQVAEGACDIGDSDVFAEEKLPADQATQLQDHKVCVVGFATIVNKSVSVDNLTEQQLIDIFTGKITNWKDVGGNDLKIVILNRPQSSGTKATFKKYALKGADEAAGQSLTEESSGAILKAVADNSGSISYLALSYVNDTVKALKYNNVEPTADNVKSGTYPIWSYEHMYTKGEASGAAKAFIDYMMSDDFKSTITELGYIPNSEMKVQR